MRGLLVCVLVVGACAADEKADPIPPAGTGGMISVGGQSTAASTADDTSSTGSSSSDGTGSSSTGDDTSSEGESSSTGALPCIQSGEVCEDDGVCIPTDDGFLCGHGQLGDPCEQPGDCASLNCFAQPDDAEAPGICTGALCERLMAPCEDDGTCVATDQGGTCSHGNVGEPCSSDADCVGGRMQCQEYPFGMGSVLLCR